MDNASTGGYRWLAVLWAVGSDLFLAGLFLVTWYAPEFLGERMLIQLLVLMIMEFVLVVCMGMFGAIGSRDASVLLRAVQFLAVFGMASLIAGGYAMVAGNLWPLFGFVLLVSSKAPATVLRPPDFWGQQLIMFNWAVTCVLLLWWIFAAHNIDLPTGGITPEIQEAQGFTGGGTWEEEPQILLATGAAYFTSLALWTLLLEALTALLRRRRQGRQESADAATASKPKGSALPKEPEA